LNLVGMASLPTLELIIKWNMIPCIWDKLFSTPAVLYQYSSVKHPLLFYSSNLIVQIFAVHSWQAGNTF
jgi:hypothetical protein